MPKPASLAEEQSRKSYEKVYKTITPTPFAAQKPGAKATEQFRHLELLTPSAPSQKIIDATLAITRACGEEKAAELTPETAEKLQNDFLKAVLNGGHLTDLNGRSFIGEGRTATDDDVKKLLTEMKSGNVLFYKDNGRKEPHHLTVFADPEKGDTFCSSKEPVDEEQLAGLQKKYKDAHPELLSQNEALTEIAALGERPEPVFWLFRPFVALIQLIAGTYTSTAQKQAEYDGKLEGLMKAAYPEGKTADWDKTVQRKTAAASMKTLEAAGSAAPEFLKKIFDPMMGAHENLRTKANFPEQHEKQVDGYQAADTIWTPKQTDAVMEDYAERFLNDYLTEAVRSGRQPNEKVLDAMNDPEKKKNLVQTLLTTDTFRRMAGEAHEAFDWKDASELVSPKGRLYQTLNAAVRDGTAPEAAAESFRAAARKKLPQDWKAPLDLLNAFDGTTFPGKITKKDNPVGYNAGFLGNGANVRPERKPEDFAATEGEHWGKYFYAASYQLAVGDTFGADDVLRAQILRQADAYLQKGKENPDEVNENVFEMLRTQPLDRFADQVLDGLRKTEAYEKFTKEFKAQYPNGMNAAFAQNKTIKTFIDRAAPAVKHHRDAERNPGEKACADRYAEVEYGYDTNPRLNKNRVCIGAFVNEMFGLLPTKSLDLVTERTDYLIRNFVKPAKKEIPETLETARESVCDRMVAAVTTEKESKELDALLKEALFLSAAESRYATDRQQSRDRQACENTLQERLNGMEKLLPRLNMLQQIPYFTEKDRKTVLAWDQNREGNLIEKLIANHGVREIDVMYDMETNMRKAAGIEPTLIRTEPKQPAGGRRIETGNKAAEVGDGFRK